MGRGKTGWDVPWGGCPCSLPVSRLPACIPAPLTFLLPWMMVRGTVVWGHFPLGGGGFSQLHSTRICRRGYQHVQGCLAGLTHWGALVHRCLQGH